MTLRRSIGGYDGASAPLEPEKDAGLSTLPFSLTHSAVPPILPPSILLVVHSLPLSLRRTYTLAVSVDRILRRFHPCLSFPDFPNYQSPSAFRFPPPLKIFPSRLYARVVRRLSQFRTPRVVSFADPFLPLHPLPPFSPAPKCPYIFTSI